MAMLSLVYVPPCRFECVRLRVRQTVARYRALLVAYLQPQRGKVALLAVLLLSAIGLQLAGPLIIRSFIDTALRHGTLPLLLGAAGLYLAVALLTQAVGVAEAYAARHRGGGKG